MQVFKPHGIIPAMVTPLDENHRVDEQALRKLTRFLIDGGVHGLFPVGTTGEFYGLSHEERRRVLEICLDETNGAVPVYMGVSAITTRESIALTRAAEDAGAAAVSVLTPMFISVSQKELYEHYVAIANETALPVLLYNNSTKTGISISADVTEKLAQIDNVVGVKDSSGDFSLTAEYIRRTRGMNFHVLAGRDTLIHACLTHGGAGAIAACANVAPRLVSDIYDRYVEGDVAGSLEAQFRLAPLRYAFTLGSFPTVIKEALSLVGIPVGECMPPTGPMTDQEREELKRVLSQMGVMT